jgi:hypothetical protein
MGAKNIIRFNFPPIEIMREMKYGKERRKEIKRLYTKKKDIDKMLTR